MSIISAQNNNSICNCLCHQGVKQEFRYPHKSQCCFCYKENISIEEKISRLEQGKESHSRSIKEFVDRLNFFSDSINNLENLINHCQDGIEKCFERIEKIESFNQDVSSIKPHVCPKCKGSGAFQPEKKKKLIYVICAILKE